VAALPDALPADFAAVEVLVNNAGLALGVHPVYENTMEDVTTVMNANVIGLIAVSTAFIPGMMVSRYTPISSLRTLLCTYTVHTLSYAFAPL
jgi:3-hydroxy acid dehydrogenase/malonic semialdehyde reductase